MVDIDKIYAALVAGRDNGQALDTWITGANARDLVRDRQRTIAEGIDALERLKRELRDGRKHLEQPDDYKHTSCYCSAPTCSPPCSFCTDPDNNKADLAPTTSTVSAPDLPLGYVSADTVETMRAGSRVLTAIIPKAILGYDQPIYAGAQAAPEDVRNQALEEAAKAMEAKAARWEREAQRHLPHWNSVCAKRDFDRRDVCKKHAAIIRALKHTSTDHADTDKE